MRHVSMIMDREDDGFDPFSTANLWRPSVFTLQPLPPLEPSSFDLPDLPGTVHTHGWGF